MFPDGLARLTTELLLTAFCGVVWTLESNLQSLSALIEYWSFS
jgi:hypothetical protein